MIRILLWVLDRKLVSFLPFKPNHFRTTVQYGRVFPDYGCVRNGRDLYFHSLSLSPFYY